MTATSSTNAWAVGALPGTPIEHWNGSAWKVVPSPGGSSPGQLFGVAATSPTNVWAVGNYFGTSVHFRAGLALRRG